MRKCWICGRFAASRMACLVGTGELAFGMKRVTICDPVVQAYKRDIDRGLLRENLKLSPAQRLEKLVRFSSFASELRRAGRMAGFRTRAGGRTAR